MSDRSGSSESTGGSKKTGWRNAGREKDAQHQNSNCISGTVISESGIRQDGHDCKSQQMRQNLKRYQDSAFSCFHVFWNIPYIWDNHRILMDGKYWHDRIEL